MKIPRLASTTGGMQDMLRGCCALFVAQDDKLLKSAQEELQHLFHGPVPLLGGKSFTGKEAEAVVLTPPTEAAKPLILIGVGRTKDLTLERLRRAAALGATQATRLRQLDLTVVAPAFLVDRSTVPLLSDTSSAEIAVALLEGAALATYSFDKYKTADAPSPLTQITIQSPTKDGAHTFKEGTHLAEIIVESVWLARDLANAPGNEIYPESFAATAKAIGRKTGFSVTIFDEKKIRSLGMGGLSGVSQGSAKPPRFLVLSYGPRTSLGPTVLVGKGVTFDSGGISIKPSANMAEMKMDMAGAAAVLGTFQAAARLKLPLQLVGLIPVTENLPGGRALKPGDILRHYNGLTSEIDNTDAEGRLILADALAYASRFHPRAVIDLATLTGAVVVALGHHATGLFGNEPYLLQDLKDAGERTGERVWELPMFDEYAALLKSDVADVKNVGGRWAGAITGALFLKRFVGAFPWAHLDIAGTAITEEALGYIPKGGSGVGVRLLVEYLSQSAKRRHRS